MPSRLHTTTVERFTCLGDRCPDTCCSGWDMQLAPATISKYRAEAPELLADVTQNEHGFIMRRDGEDGHCVRFDAGWCNIHSTRGESFLGDGCYFFPRIPRALGDTVVVSAALSCPETARIMLLTDNAFAYTDRRDMRDPYLLRNYLPEGMGSDDALLMHGQLIATVDDAPSAEHAYMRISAVTRALETQAVAQWPAAFGFYLRMADGRIPAPEVTASDPFNLMQAFYGLMMASPSRRRPNLLAYAERMADAVGVNFADEGRQMILADDAALRVLALLRQWQAHEARLQPMLKRYLQAQLSQALFPFAGFGDSLSARMTIIGVRMATIKLGMMALVQQGQGEEAEIVALVHTLSRFMDHLASPELSMRIYKETGWIREPRIRALLEWAPVF